MKHEQKNNCQDGGDDEEDIQSLCNAGKERFLSRRFMNVKEGEEAKKDRD